MSTTTTELGEVMPIVGTGAPSVGGEAARYLAASVAALALDSTLLWIGAGVLSLPSWLAGAFSYAVGLVLVYVLSTRWVFARRVVADRRREFIVFAILGTVGLLMNSITLFVATGLGLALPIAKALAAGIGFVTNFASRKVLLFSSRKP